jgi:hypothetical protein
MCFICAAEGSGVLGAVETTRTPSHDTFKLHNYSKPEPKIIKAWTP